MLNNDLLLLYTDIIITAIIVDGLQNNTFSFTTLFSPHIFIELLTKKYQQ
jgi:hypothetical protein